jgi:hypothetical protein
MRKKMNLKRIKIKGRIASSKSILAAFLILCFLLPLPGQKKLQTSPGGYHGELDFPISWKRYYSYAEWTKIMHDLARQYNQLAEIQSIGRSRMGREMYLLTITNKSTGKPENKPAMWVDGAIHGNEVNGITCSLYLAWYLLTRYDYDPYVYDLVNRYTFYILPGFNVDANDSYVTWPNTANNPREPYRPEDDDGDGLYDEDQTEDVDGDGELSLMYVEDPQGDFKLSPDGRRFVRVTEPNDPSPRFRLLGPEGFDNDGDGRLNEDDIGGPDPNRNFPADWNLQQGNPYPLSEPETRNVYEFWLQHPNILASFHYHNTGRLIMFSTPPRVQPALTPEQRQQRQQQFQQRLAELRQTNKYAQLFDIEVPPEYQEDLRVQTEIVTMGARILKNYRPTPSGRVGQAQAASYEMFGRYAYLIELWGTPDFEADENGDGRVSDEEFLKWIDIELTGEGWINPHKVHHPDYGEIWIGGTAKKHITRTPPARYMEEEALRNTHFVLYCVSQFPKVEIDDIKITPLTADLFWIDVRLKNERAYPTSSDRAVQLGRAVMDKLIFNCSPNISLIELPAALSALDLADRTSLVPVAKGKEVEFRLKGHDSLTYRYLIRLTGESGWVEFNVISKNGGKDSRRLTIKTG